MPGFSLFSVKAQARIHLYRTRLHWQVSKHYCSFSNTRITLAEHSIFTPRKHKIKKWEWHTSGREKPYPWLPVPLQFSPFPPFSTPTKFLLILLPFSAIHNFHWNSPIILPRPNFVVLPYLLNQLRNGEIMLRFEIFCF